KAFQQVFGNTIICPDLSIAAQYARSHGVNAITLAGDRSDKRGALTGGYHDTHRSRLNAVTAARQWRDEVDQLQSRSEEISRILLQKEQEVTRAMGELQKAEGRRQQIEDSFGPMRGTLQQKQAQLGVLRDNLSAKEKSLENIDISLR